MPNTLQNGSTCIDLIEWTGVQVEMDVSACALVIRGPAGNVIPLLRSSELRAGNVAGVSPKAVPVSASFNGLDD